MSLIFSLLSRLSLPTCHRLGGLLGGLVYRLSSRYRRTLQANLRQATGDAPPALCREIAAETGKQMLELPRIWLRSLDQAVADVVAVEGWKWVEAARQSGKGILFITPHLGCFEITAQFLSTRAPITVLYRPPRQAAVQTLIETGRKRDNLHLAPADLSGVRSLVKALRKGEDVGLLPDQAPKLGEGVWLDFFGRPAYTMTLAARLSETGAATLMIWGERLPAGQGYRIHITPTQQPLQGSTIERAAQINREVEALILTRPEQYLWAYNRYKRPAGAEPPPGAAV
ncbi:MAG: hypothetical protein RIR00_248 [Pseudomonadota bacterium]|jgi:KDO2-lipid IV(A) lauroyltransferase